MGLRSWWERERLPRIMDRGMADTVNDSWREQTCRPATGTVVELGFGGGLNLPFYGPRVDRVLAVEPSDLAWDLGRERRTAARFPVERVGLDGARLPIASGNADTVVSTWSLCTIADLDAALAEIRRVLSPDGVLRFAEHGLAEEPRIARRQRRIQRLWGAVSGGCHVDRDIPALLRDGRFEVTLDRQEFAMTNAISKPFAWYYSGVAAPLR